ncbi:hypothetical protein HMPREF0971_01138 [Segatella oris F0302]|uniref:Uncharacterized protein n=1 Tax=Segatella oris F0302 TaxID=649760 RepID=D1QQ90_9BACT|nr:hypothetical protein HMPREF0971_01138 [Segatella oris F0302]
MLLETVVIQACACLRYLPMLLFCSFTEHLYSVFLSDVHTMYKSLPPACSFR